MQKDFISQDSHNDLNFKFKYNVNLNLGGLFRGSF